MHFTRAARRREAVRPGLDAGGLTFRAGIRMFTTGLRIPPGPRSGQLPRW
jgi:hypothetical protein